MVEMVVVSVIVSILSTVLVTSYWAYRRSRQVRSAASSVSSVMSSARSFAIATNQWHRVVLQARNPMTGEEEYSLWVDEIEGGSNETPNPALPPTPIRPKIVTPLYLPTGIRVPFVVARPSQEVYVMPDNGYMIFRFRPDGSSDFGAVVLDTVSTGDGSRDRMTVRLYGSTGKAKAYDGVVM